LLALVLLLPLIYTQGLPELKLLSGVSPVVSLPAGARPKPEAARHVAHPSESNQTVVGLIEPTRVPDHIADIRETKAPDAVELTGIGVPFGTGDPRARGIIDGIAGATGSALPPPKPKPVSRPVPRTSVIMEGYLVHRVQPIYPPLAKAARIQGPVELRAIISKDGFIENLRVLGGHPMLVTAAVDAVKQWRYRPYVLNGEPVEVETQITVNFVLSGS
jgi:periplasmic protein TonB